MFIRASHAMITILQHETTKTWKALLSNFLCNI
jgi:hypothetical protein